MESISHLSLAREFIKIKNSWNSACHFILKSPTGSGKSIALPLLLASSGLIDGKIMVVQPRRLAARMLARQVAKITGWSLGKEVGYHVRFDASYTTETRILYVTDGIAKKKLLHEGSIAEYQVLIFDEFHERSAQIDLCLALAVSIWSRTRPDLRIFVASATLDIRALADYLPQSKSIELSDRSYPIQIEYSGKRREKSFSLEVCRFLPKILTKTDGDILIFMDGSYEISKLQNLILRSSWSKGLDVFPLYGDLPTELQDQAIAPSRRRKIIISTNIAETSLTISGIKVVIDTGVAKKFIFNPIKGINRLETQPICLSSAAQRSGRAGRTGPGYCLRLWSEKENQTRPEFDPPEIQCIDLSQIYLNLLGCGIELEGLNLLEEIPSRNLEKARQYLKILGALDEAYILTEHGKKMSQLPIHPSWGHALYIGKEKGLTSTVSLLLALLEERPPVEAESLPDFYPAGTPRSDVFCLLLAFEEAKRNQFNVQHCKKLGIHAKRCLEAEKVARSLCELVGEVFSLTLPPYEEFARLLVGCFPSMLCHLVSEGRSIYQDELGRRFHLSRRSVIKSEKFLIPLKIIEKTIKGSMVMEMEWSTGVDEKWIRETLNNRIEKKEDVFLDLSTRRVLKQCMEGWGSFILSSSEKESTSPSDRGKAYGQAIIKGDIKLKTWNDRVENFLMRVAFLSHRFPEFEIKEIDQETKLIFLEEFCQTGSSWKEIRNREVYLPLVSCYSDEEQKIIEEAVPEKITLGCGKHSYTLDYSQQNEVILKAKLQDLYDLPEHPTIVFGKYPLIVELLAPNHRPVQRTSDLLGFWKGAYPMIRKELAGRYPKHEWR